eukprot:516396-Amphidinium_carterae.1
MTVSSSILLICTEQRRSNNILYDYGSRKTMIATFASYSSMHSQDSIASMIIALACQATRCANSYSCLYHFFDLKFPAGSNKQRWFLGCCIPTPLAARSRCDDGRRACTYKGNSARNDEFAVWTHRSGHHDKLPLYNENESDGCPNEDSVWSGGMLFATEMSQSEWAKHGGCEKMWL